MYPQSKSQIKGFTIVELLIVIVIIAILAAITIVAYNGIQNRAKTSSAQSAANTAAKKAEAYNADISTTGYPPSGITLTSAAPTETYKLDGVTFDSAFGNSSNAPNLLRYQVCGHNGTSTAPTTFAGITSGVIGARIQYFDYGGGGIQTIGVGQSTVGGNPNINCINRN